MLLLPGRCARVAYSRSGHARDMLLVLCLVLLAGARAKPNIVLIIADDLGWNDVGFHGLCNIPTPNIDALAASGVVLQHHYVAPVCTPSRAALMTGKYPIHTGMQHGVLYGMDAKGLPLTEKILPQYLKELGYKTHLVGKWHLGSYKREYLPINRGFDSHAGFWTGKIDMYDHTNMEQGSWGFDFRRGFDIAHDLFGKYATDIYTQEAVKIIQTHNDSEPLFLEIAHSAVHSGNPPEFIRAPDKTIDTFAYINDTQRRKFAAVLSILDDSVGRVISALQARGLLRNSVVLFSTDNGGVPAGFNDNAGSNYPFRGTKNTLWEGGVRGAAVLWSPLLEERQRVAAQRMHLVDWLPTLLGVAGGNVSMLKGIDGVDQWAALSRDGPSARTSLVHNIDDLGGSAAITIDKWKLVTGTTYKGAWDSWYGPDGRDGTYDVDLVYNGPAGQAIHELSLMPSRETFVKLREAATIICNESLPEIKCKPLVAPCLFNIEEDPCERRNLAEQEPNVLAEMLAELSKVNSTAVPPNTKPLDPHGDPKYWGRVYTNFGDYELTHEIECD